MTGEEWKGVANDCPRPVAVSMASVKQFQVERNLIYRQLLRRLPQPY